RLNDRHLGFSLVEPWRGSGKPLPWVNEWVKSSARQEALTSSWAGSVGNHQHVILRSAHPDPSTTKGFYNRRHLVCQHR
ncbi:MAG: hypothetical protein ACREA0_27950, partial [bacterium]